MSKLILQNFSSDQFCKDFFCRPTFWSTWRSREVTIISAFLSCAVSLAISTPFVFVTSSIRELALRQVHVGTRFYKIVSDKRCRNKNISNLLAQLCLRMLFQHLIPLFSFLVPGQVFIQRPSRDRFVTNLTVKSSTVLLRMSSLDLNPATTSLVLSYFRWRSLKARSTAWRSSRICALSVCSLAKIDGVR